MFLAGGEATPVPHDGGIAQSTTRTLRPCEGEPEATMFP